MYVDSHLTKIAFHGSSEEIIIIMIIIIIIIVMGCKKAVPNF